MGLCVRLLILSSVLLSSSGCAAIPEIPQKSDLPVKKIITHSVCELAFAFEALKKEQLKNFDPTGWAMSISLTPKIDQTFDARIGRTEKSSTVNTFFNSWALGTSPGAGANVKGHADGSVTYNVHSSALLSKTFNRVKCETSTTAYHSLLQNLGIRDWLLRTALAAEGDLSNLTSVDKPTYSAEIITKFDAGGSFTYNFPLGTSFMSGSTSYSRDEILSIVLTRDPAKVPVRTLPEGGDIKGAGLVRPSLVSPGAIDRLDRLQLQQTIQNLRIQSQ